MMNPSNDNGAKWNGAKWIGAGLALAFGVASCCGARPELSATPAPDAGAGGGSGVASDGPPRLVVAIVIDQLGSWVLERYLPHLDPEGFFRTATEAGAYYRRVSYPYASTFTAPGHAAIFTGKAPADSGIVTNSYHDPVSGKGYSAVADPAHPVLGHPGAHLSPKNLRVPTVGDALKEQRDGAKVFALSLKDRAAILPGGHKADLAVWYDYKVPGFTTSTYYADALPAWLDQWLDDHPLANILSPWLPADPALLARLAGDDDAAGEGDYMGLGATFPHDPLVARVPWSGLRVFPQLTEYTTELAAAMAAGAKLGKDDTVDLLIVSISGLDYTGHTYGPQSWEYVDHLIRADAALAKMVAVLNERHGPVRYLLTADHGITPTPDKNPEGGGRLYPDAVTKLAKDAVGEALGDRDLVDRYKRPYVYFSPQLPADKRAAAIAAVAKALGAHQGIRLAVDVVEARTWRDDGDRVRRSIGLSIADPGPGDMYVCPEEHWVVDEGRPKGGGTTHGTPYANDREVPLVIWGPGIEHVVHEDEVSLLRVAATLAALLDVKPPSGVSEEPLPF
jgi:Type I phosphodiesterase / nucleotide pyrophosphatase